MNDYIFFHKKTLPYFEQFGIRSKGSTIDSLAEITEQSKQGSTDTLRCIMLDLRKAFDSTNYPFLVAKLEKYCVRGYFSGWFESILEEKC